jgi:hypothetical protein
MHTIKSWSMRKTAVILAVGAGVIAVAGASAPVASAHCYMATSGWGGVPAYSCTTTSGGSDLGPYGSGNIIGWAINPGNKANYGCLSVWLGSQLFPWECNYLAATGGEYIPTSTGYSWYYNPGAATAQYEISAPF